MAQYLLSVWHDDTYDLDFSSDDALRRIDQVSLFNDDLHAAGSLVFACGLLPKSEASVARWDGRSAHLTQGPFTAAPEQTGGFWIIDVDSQDAARHWALRAAAASEAAIEVRALQD